MPGGPEFSDDIVGAHGLAGPDFSRSRLLLLVAEIRRPVGRARCRAYGETRAPLPQERRYLISDRDTKFCRRFREILTDAGVQTRRIAWRCPNMNAYAERWVRSVKEECLRKVLIFDEQMLREALRQGETYPPIGIG